jgi:hypothetical protein
VLKIPRSVIGIMQKEVSCVGDVRLDVWVKRSRILNGEEEIGTRDYVTILGKWQRCGRLMNKE